MGKAASTSCFYFSHCNSITGLVIWPVWHSPAHCFTHSSQLPLLFRCSRAMTTVKFAQFNTPCHTVSAWAVPVPQHVASCLRTSSRKRTGAQHTDLHADSNLLGDFVPGPHGLSCDPCCPGPVPAMLPGPAPALGALPATALADSRSLVVTSSTMEQQWPTPNSMSSTWWRYNRARMSSR